MQQASASGKAYKTQKFLWAEIANVPEGPGVYAWYYIPELTLFDLDNAIVELQALMQSSQEGEARSFVHRLLDERLFQYFREEPYHTVIRGPLKPSYEGYLEHKQIISDSLVSRIIESPERLRIIREILEVSAPDFASPIYIGMSENLRQRLGKHKSLIEKYRQGRTRTDGPRAGDAGFASQIVGRRIPPERLFVVTCEIRGADDIEKDVENILNRIFYPVLGRN